MLTDIEIAKSSKMMPISQIAQKLNIDEENIEYYQYIEKYGNVSMYYDFGADYYFFVEE